jgi:endonuclease-3 related protein
MKSTSRAARQDTSTRLRDIYERLLARFGHAGWWPGETALEVCIGAVLVQNTSWSNVEKALAVLRGRGLLGVDALLRLGVDELEVLIRSSGTFRVKARRLRALLEFLATRYPAGLQEMASEQPEALRRALLAVPGVGRETADSIVLYAAGLPLFVVDGYTRRVLARLGLVRGDEPYDELQRFFHERLPPRAELFNDFHAQLVRLGKEVCRPRPLCQACPLEKRCGKRGI